MPSPLGKYSEVAAALGACAILLVWLASLVGVLTRNDTLDAAAFTVIGVLLGQRQTTNGAAKVAAAAHKRLDAIHAPPAENTPST